MQSSPRYCEHDVSFERGEDGQLRFSKKMQDELVINLKSYLADFSRRLKIDRKQQPITTEMLFVHLAQLLVCNERDLMVKLKQIKSRPDSPQDENQERVLQELSIENITKRAKLTKDRVRRQLRGLNLCD